MKERFGEAAAKVVSYLNSICAGPTGMALRSELAPFIIPAPDPLESWLHKSGYEGNSVVEQALADLTKSGGKIVWENEP